MCADGEYYRIPDESMMITGDMNNVNIDIFIERKISGPYKYLLAAKKLKALQALFQDDKTIIR